MFIKTAQLSFSAKNSSSFNYLASLNQQDRRLLWDNIDSEISRRFLVYSMLRYSLAVLLPCSCSSAASILLAAA